MRVYRYTPGTSDREKRQAAEAERIRDAARLIQQGRNRLFLAARFRPEQIEKAKGVTGRRA